MPSSIDPLLLLVLALSYSLLVVVRKDSFWFIACALFIITSLLVRLSIDVDTVRDFSPYYNSFVSVKHGYVAPELLVEPYRLILYKIVIAFGGENDFRQITAIYYLHFFFVTSFFIWLSSLKDVPFSAKLVLFLAYYPPMAFVWLRAGMAYVASCYLIYTFTRGKISAIQFILPAIHLSSLPILIVTWFDKVSRSRKILLVGAGFVLAIGVLDSSYANYTIAKWTRYYETGSERNSSNLLLLHGFNIALFIYFSVIDTKFRTSFPIVTLMATYLLLYFFSPVMGLRIFPFVLIATIVQRIPFNRYRRLTLVIVVCLVPVYVSRFDQILL